SEGPGADSNKNAFQSIPERLSGEFLLADSLEVSPDIHHQTYSTGTVNVYSRFVQARRACFIIDDQIPKGKARKTDHIHYDPYLSADRGWHQTGPQDVDQCSHWPLREGI
ncbi:hypothetical protein PISMIDRAFT_687802, partial [Pisolithus microcarpus 441]